MNFDQAFDKLIGHEGGYVNDPADPGGETNWGISKRAYPTENIRALTRERAKELYYRDYWTPMVDDWNIRPSMRFQVFDVAVNHGLQRAVKLLQQTAGLPLDQVDGVWGPLTNRAVSNIPDLKITEWFNGWRLKFYLSIPRDKWERFGHGWIDRVAKNLLEPE